jgi:hypothetical protein
MKEKRNAKEAGICSQIRLFPSLIQFSLVLGFISVYLCSSVDKKDFS